VCLVVGGLCVTGITLVLLGPNVVRGALLVTVGSALYVLMYAFSESVMNTTNTTTAAAAAAATTTTTSPTEEASGTHYYRC